MSCMYLTCTLELELELGTLTWYLTWTHVHIQLLALPRTASVVPWWCRTVRLVKQQGLAIR